MPRFLGFRLLAAFALASVLLAALLLGPFAGLAMALVLLAVAQGRPWLLAIAVLLAPAVACAADASTSIDLAPLVSTLVPLVLGVAGILLPVVLNRIAQATHSQTLAAVATNFMPMAQLALANAQGPLKDWIATKGLTADVHNVLVKEAGDWLADHAKAEIDAKGYTPAQVANQLSAMIHLNTTPPEQSVALPTPPAAPGATPATPAAP